MQAYGLFKKDHEESGRIKPFADPLLYSGSLKYKIFEVNDTILGPHGAARTRRTLPRLPKNPTALLPKARINQFRQYHDVVSILDDFSKLSRQRRTWSGQVSPPVGRVRRQEAILPVKLRCRGRSDQVSSTPGQVRGGPRYGRHHS